jgi:hypothetical protein
MFQLVKDINVALLLPAIKHAIKTIHTYKQYAYLLLKETRQVFMDWINLAQETGKSWAVVNTYALSGSIKIHGISCLFVWHKIFSGQSKKFLDLTEFCGPQCKQNIHKRIQTSISN